MCNQEDFVYELHEMMEELAQWDRKLLNKELTPTDW